MHAARRFIRPELGLLIVLVSTSTLVAQTAPTISTQPANRTVTVGATASFTVVASGNPAPTYQWRRNGAIIAGATAATYVTPVTVIGDNGSLFSVAVTNIVSTVISANAILTVNQKATVDVSGPSGIAAGQTATFTAAASGGTPPFTYQWFRNSITPANLIPGATNSTYTTPVVNVTADNNTDYFVRITDGSGIVTDSIAKTLFVFPGQQTITFNAPANPVVSPVPIALVATSTSGLPVTFALLSGPATLNGANLTLTGLGNVTIRAAQAGSVNFNPAVPVERTITVNKGTPVITWTVAGAVPDGSILSAAQLNATANVAGTFAYNPASGTTLRAPSVTLNVTFTPADTVNYNPATAQRTLAVTAASDPARLTNVSVRTSLSSGQTLIVGFTMQGGTKPVLLRAVGPGLNQFGVGGTMADPRMELFRGTTTVEANDNWGGSEALSASFASVGAFALPATSLDAALLRSIEGGHTVQINGPAGVVLVEAYDAGSGASPRLSNVSARNRAGTGTDILIAGFTIGGTGQANLLIRGVGPTLAALGVTNAIFDPKIEVYSGAAKISENDTWPVALAPTFATVGAFPLTAGSRDAALTLSLSSGSYTVQVLGADGGTGEAVVEIYELP